MRKLRLICIGVLIFVLCGCSASEIGKEAVWISQGYLKNECVAQVGEKFYTFLPMENENTREFLYEIDETGNRIKIVCEKESCEHEQQGQLVDPCNAFDYATLGLIADGEYLYSGSHNGSVGISKHSIKNGSKETILQTELPISSFYVEDGNIYYAQQDQTFGEPILKSDNSGYRLYVNRIDMGTEKSQLVYERKGVIGYIASIQKYDKVLFLTEVFYSTGDVLDAKTNVIMLDCASGEIIKVIEDVGGHNIAKIDRLFAIPATEGGIVLIDENGSLCEKIDCGEKAMCVAIGDYLLVDSIVEGERKLEVYNKSFERLGNEMIPEGYGYLLGADVNHVYYWNENGENQLEDINWRECIEKSAV